MIGYVKVLYLGLICYVVRLFYYLVIFILWMVFVVEFLFGIIIVVVWVVCLLYVSINLGLGVVIMM